MTKTRSLMYALYIIALTGFSQASFGKGNKPEPEAVPGEYVLRLKKTNQVRQYLIGQRGESRLSSLLGVPVKSIISEDFIAVVRLSAVETRGSAVKRLLNNPLIEVAEPNYIYYANRVPNDAMYGRLWGIKNSGQSDSSNNAGVVGMDIDAERAWDIETGSEQTLVAVIDTGADYNHPDLRANMWTNQAELNGKPGVDDDGNGFVDDIHGYNFADENGTSNDPMDDHGHGSHCSGTIGATGDDGSGIVGVNWKVRIMPVKFLNSGGSGTLEGAIRATDYAVKMGAKILSNSWGGGGFSQNLKDAIERAHAAGVLYVAAAGNDSTDNDSDPHYPSSYDTANIISVAAIDNRGAVAYFSNFGKKSVHVGAPGVNIYSSLPGGKYDSWSGTSMATPHVSGVAALLASHEPMLTAVEIKNRILSTVRKITSLKYAVSSGGLVNAYNALRNSQSLPDPNDPALWASKQISVSTLHPYKGKTHEEFEVSVDGAKEISLYFSRFDTENNYDKLTVLDRSGRVLAVLSGNYDESFSPIFSGDYVKLVFESDESVERYGIEISKVAYR